MAKAPTIDNWVQDMAFEVALGYFAPDELQLKYDLSPAQYDHIVRLPAFKKASADYRREIDDEGIAFKLRARKCAEEILDELYAMSFDTRVDAKDRLKAMEMMCRYAGFEAQRVDDGGGVKLQIFTNLSLGNTPQQTYTIEIPKEKLESPTA